MTPDEFIKNAAMLMHLLSEWREGNNDVWSELCELHDELYDASLDMLGDDLERDRMEAFDPHRELKAVAKWN